MIAQHKALLVINPISGTLSKEGLRERVEEELRAKGIEVSTEFTGYPGAAYDLSVKGIDNGCDIIIAAGGDGTFHECAEACRDRDTALGLIPCGSGNGFARHLGIPLNVKGSLDIIAGGHIVGCDYGDVNGNPFFCTMGVGFDATVSHKFAGLKRRGRMSYVKTAMQEYLSYQPAEYMISSNGNVLTERALVVAICNVSQYGNNAYIAPRASLTDGLLDVTVIRNGPVFQQAMAGIGLLSGQIDRNRYVDTFKARDVKIIRLKDGPAQIDGEPLTLGRKVSIHCEHACLKVLGNGSEPEFRPIITPVQAFFADMISDLRYLTRPL